MGQDDFLSDLAANHAAPELVDTRVAERIAALSGDIDLEEVKAIVADVAKIEDGLERTNALRQIHAKTKLPLTGLKEALKKSTPQKRASQPDRTGTAHKRLAQKLDREPRYPPSGLVGDLKLETVDGNTFFGTDGDTGFKPMFSYVEQHQDARFIDWDRVVARRGAVMNASCELVPFTIPAADLIGNGNPVAKAIAAKGGGVTLEGETKLRLWFGAAPTLPVDVVHRPRFVTMEDGSKVWVSPTGETIPPDAGLELADEVRLTCEARGGSEELAVQHAQALFDLADQFPVPAFALTVGLLAPLNDLLEAEPAVYLLDGPSSSGKSGQAGLAAACWAYGGDKSKIGGLFRKASGTANSYEGMLQTTGSAFLGLDEVGKIKGDGFQGLLYEMQGGVGKARMNADMTSRRLALYGSCTVLATMETDYAQLLRESGKKAAGGDTVRFMPVSTAGREELTPEVFEHIDGVKESFGHLVPRLVRHLFSSGLVDDPSRLRELNATYTRELTDSAGSSAKRVERAARLPALLRLALEIGKEAGIVPPTFNAASFVQQLWNDALQGEMGAGKSAMDRAVAHLCEGIVARIGSEIVDFYSREEAKREVIGYTGLSVAGKSVIVLRTEEMMNILCAGVSERSLRRHLFDAGILVKNDKKADSLTWSGFPGLGKGGSYTALLSSEVIEGSDGQVKTDLDEAFDDAASHSAARAAKMAGTGPTVH